jgi:hypothetical protein
VTLPLRLCIDLWLHLAFDPSQARQDEANDSIANRASNTRGHHAEHRCGTGAVGRAAMFALPPVAGALLQKEIDIAVIVNALRALGDGERRVGRSKFKCLLRLKFFSKGYPAANNRFAHR